ncbi:MAG: methyltransferase domain-containing protein [Rhodospirillales bacterium]|jgi:SAM-dependent methyltransferase|nr:methyltransferase domain-containing protein [Rhodospirillales bacterium]
MVNSINNAVQRRHLRITAPSPWVKRFASLIAPGGRVLDLACGNGRHARHMIEQGCSAVVLDRDVAAVADLAGSPKVHVIEADLEDGTGWPLAGQRFDGIIVVNYLHRPIFPHLLDGLADGGVLIYETFARGNEVFWRPRNPDHLLRSGELLAIVGDRLQIVAYEHGLVETGPLPGVIQRICAVNDRARSTRADGEPPIHRVEGPPD